MSENHLSDMVIDVNNGFCNKVEVRIDGWILDKMFAGVYNKEVNLLNGRYEYKHVSSSNTQIQYTLKYNEQQLSWEVKVIFSRLNSL